MRIVQAHKYYWHRDGASNYVLDWTHVLEERGHEVAPFAMQGNGNLPNPWSRYFISETDLRSPEFSPWYLAKAAGRFFYSFEAKNKFTGLCEAFKPDLLHVHNLYHHLSQSPLDVARTKNIPTVMTLHDYALLSSNYSLSPRGTSYYPHRLLARVFAHAGFLFERWRGAYEQTVRYFIAPTQFVKDLFVEYDFPAERIRVIPYFVSLVSKTELPPVSGPAYFLYVGRLSPEKGVATLLQALARLGPEFHLKIVGSGSQDKELKVLTEQLHLLDRVEFLDYRPPEEVRDLMSRALAVCVPSLWYEIFGLVALEAMAQGVPVLASNIGGLPEVVGSGGWLVKSGEVEAWSEQMKYILNHPQEADKVGRQAAARASEFTVERHYRAVMALYQSAITVNQVNQAGK